MTGYNLPMRVQLDRFEDNDQAVLLLFPDGRRSFDAPRELLPPDARPGDVFNVCFERDDTSKEWLADENQRLMDKLLGRDG